MTETRSFATFLVCAFRYAAIGKALIMSVFLFPESRFFALFYFFNIIIIHYPDFVVNYSSNKNQVFTAKFTHIY